MGNGISTGDFISDPESSAEDVKIVSFLNGRGQVLANCLYGGATAFGPLLKLKLKQVDDSYILPLGLDSERVFTYIKKSSGFDFNRDKMDFKIMDIYNDNLLTSTKRALIESIIEAKVPNLLQSETQCITNVLLESSALMRTISDTANKKRAAVVEPERASMEVFYLDKLGIGDKKSCYIGQEYVTRYLTRNKKGFNNDSTRRGLLMTATMLKDDKWLRSFDNRDSSLLWTPPSTIDYRNLRGCVSSRSVGGLFLSMKTSQKLIQQYLPSLI